MPLWECKYLWWSWKENKDLCVRNCFILPKPLECNSCHTLLKTNKIGEIYSEMPSYKYKSLSRKLYTHNLPNYIKQFQVICWWQNCDRKRIFGVGVAITTAVHSTLPSIEGDLDLYRWYVLKSKNYHGFHVFHSMWCYLGLFKLHVACEGLCTWEHWLLWFKNPIIVLDHNVF